MSAKSPLVIAPIDFDAATRAIDTFSARRHIPSMVFPPEAGREGEGTTPVPAAVPITPAPVSAMPIARRVKLQRIPVEMPDYVFDEIKRRALSSRCSARHVILKALRSAGIHIAEDDMPEDGRRLRGMAK